MDRSNKRKTEFRRQDSYETGSTRPPKKRGGLVAGLLVAVILLIGASSILGTMNVRLFQEMYEDKTISFFQEASEQSGTQQNVSSKSGLGLTGDAVSELDQQFYQLPAGFLIADIEENGGAAKAGLAVGDVIVSVNGVDIQTAEALEKAIEDCRAGDCVVICFYRYRTGEQMQTTVILETDEEG